MIPIDSKWFQMISNDSKWFQKRPNDSKRLKKYYKKSQKNPFNWELQAVGAQKADDSSP